MDSPPNSPIGDTVFKDLEQNAENILKPFYQAQNEIADYFAKETRPTEDPWWFNDLRAALVEFVIANASVVQKIEMGHGPGSMIDRVVQLNDAMNAFLARTGPVEGELLKPDV